MEDSNQSRMIREARKVVEIDEQKKLAAQAFGEAVSQAVS
jgi:hypothetical protein